MHTWVHYTVFMIICSSKNNQTKLNVVMIASIHAFSTSGLGLCSGGFSLSRHPQSSLYPVFTSSWRKTKLDTDCPTQIGKSTVFQSGTLASYLKCLFSTWLPHTWLQNCPNPCWPEVNMTTSFTKTNSVILSQANWKLSSFCLSLELAGEKLLKHKPQVWLN